MNPLPSSSIGTTTNSLTPTTIQANDDVTSPTPDRNRMGKVKERFRRVKEKARSLVGSIVKKLFGRNDQVYRDTSTYYNFKIGGNQDVYIADNCLFEALQQNGQ